MSTFTIRPYAPGDEHGIVDLFNRVFAPGNPTFVPRDVELWRHIYLANPAGLQTLVALDGEGAVIGNYSAIPVAVSVRGRRRLAGQIVDTCLDAAWRGLGRRDSVFRTITRAWVEHFGSGAPGGDDFIYGVIDEEVYKIGHRVVGYEAVHWPVPGLAAALDARRCEALEARAGDVVVAPGDGRELEAVAALFERHLDEVPLGLWKDAAYLAWRYRDWPGAPFTTLLARRGGELVGALVLRVGIEWEARPTLLVVDWIGPGADAQATAALLAGAGRLALEHGRERLETWVRAGTPRHRSLAALGLSEEGSRFHSAVVIFSGEFDHRWLSGHWCYAMGDFDVY